MQVLAREDGVTYTKLGTPVKGEPNPKAGELYLMTKPFNLNLWSYQFGVGNRRNEMRLVTFPPETIIMVVDAYHEMLEVEPYEGEEGEINVHYCIIFSCIIDDQVYEDVEAFFGEWKAHFKRLW